MAFPSDRDRFEPSFVLGADKDTALAELAVDLQQGEILTYVWDADDEAEFNIHSHEGEEVTYHEESKGRGAEGTFEAPHAGAFYLMWQNPGSEPLEIRLKARRKSR